MAHPNKKWPELAIWFANIWGRKRHPSERGQGGPGGDFYIGPFMDFFSLRRPWTFQEKEHEGTIFTWLVVWNNFYFSITYMGISSSQLLLTHIFQRGRSTTNLIVLPWNSLMIGWRKDGPATEKRRVFRHWNGWKWDWGNHLSVKCSSWG